MTRMWDVSVPIRSGMATYPGNPAVSVTLEQAVTQGKSANVSRIDFGSHTGTHVDAPRHFFDDAPGVDALPLERLCGPCRLVAVDDGVRAVGEAELRAFDLAGVERVLIRSRNSAWLAAGDPEFHPDYTYVAPDGAAYLVSLGVQLVGVDYLSVEQFHSGHHRTHRTLLEREVVIVEGLSLAGVPAGDYELLCLPLRLAGGDGAPARVVLRG